MKDSLNLQPKGYSEATGNALKFEKIWELKDSKAVWNPESIFYDMARNCIWVVNTADGETECGFISKISLEGKVIEERVLGGLLAARGSEIHGDSLFFNQLQELTEMNLDTGEILNSYFNPLAVALNDIAIDQDGCIYSSDLLGDAIFRLKDGKFEQWLLDIDGLERPNGLMCEGDIMYLCPWGGGDHQVWETKVGSTVKTIDLRTKEIKLLGKAKIGPLDGLEDYDQDHIIISNWWEGKIYLVNKKNGEVQLVLNTHEMSAGDIHYIIDKRILLIPQGNQNKVMAYKAL